LSEEPSSHRLEFKKLVHPDTSEQIACGVAMTSGLRGSVLTSTLNQLSQVFPGIHNVPPECVRRCTRIPFPADIKELPVRFARPV
jgi:hypothetical protein